MPVSHRINARVLGACVAVLATAATLALAPAAGAAKIGNTYLALGDSLAYGYHQAQFEAEFPNVKPESFDEGYVNDFYSLLTFLHPGVQLINDGCPGEGTETMIHGSGVPGFCGGEDASPFPYIWLHHPYGATSQLADALAILHANPDVNPITIDIGANDLIRFTHASCGFPAADTCTEAQFAAEIGHIASNLAFILGQLHAAAPNAQIVVEGIYNAYPAYPSEGGDKVVAGLNKAEETVAKSVPGASFADPQPFFNPSLVTGGPETQDEGAICALTGMCPNGTYEPANPKADIHPTKLGYAVMAGVLAFDFLTH